MPTALEIALYGALLSTTLLFTRLLLPTIFPSESDKFWAKLDAVGVPANGPESLRWPRAVASSLTNLVQNTHEGYNKINKKLNKPFALPAMWTGKAVVVMPPNRLDLVFRPESELLAFWALVENIQILYFINRDVMANAIHFEVARKDLSKKNLGRMAPATGEEVDFAFRTVWGDDTEHTKDVNGWDVCGSVIARVGMRALIGEPMCRNEHLLQQCKMFANLLFASATLINSTPPFMRPVLGPLLALPTGIFARRVKKVMVPHIEERTRLHREHQRTGKGELPVGLLLHLYDLCTHADSSS